MVERRRIDTHPTFAYKGWQLCPGRPLPFGASRVPGGVNFSIMSRHATGCTLVLFERGATTPLVELPFFEQFRVGDVYAMIVFDLDAESIEYGYRFEGPFAPERGHRFDASRVLLDPNAREIGGRDVWGAPARQDDPYPYRARVLEDDFDWRDDRLPGLPMEDLVIYELHVRGFTQHPSSGVRHRGTFMGLREKIGHLVELGVNCVELMPIFEFDELDNKNFDPETGEPLKNYWGYNTVGFFAPKAGFAATGALGLQADELKALVLHLHRHGIEVVLDVVLNHTAEGDARGETISYRGIDNKTWYILDGKGEYRNYSGVGNTLNCNNPVVRNHMLECLRYWVAAYHIDGFRFDLASILGRDPQGEPLENPPLLEALAYDPVLSKTRLIAEAWDAGGLYQVGNFPSYERRWTEWNGQYRDALRRFLKGDEGMVPVMALRLAGSPDLYPTRGTTASVNFVTCHDGFTLADLVAFSKKHNWRNGEQGRDGNDDNISWHWGVEGPTEDPALLALRRRLMKNAIAMLMVSQGVPMILMGDEFARSQDGNNNAYCHDTPWNWLDWSLREENADMFRFFKLMIAFRHAHPALRSAEHLKGVDIVGSGFPDLSWHGIEPWKPDFNPWSRSLAMLLCGRHAKGGAAHDDMIYVAMNMHWEPHRFGLPHLPRGWRWRRALDTALPSPDDIVPSGAEVPLDEQAWYPVQPRSVVVLIGR